MFFQWLRQMRRRLTGSLDVANVGVRDALALDVSVVAVEPET